MARKSESKPKSREEIIQQDVKDLHKLGYAQQLFREMGGFSNFAISFSIISILTGAILVWLWTQFRQDQSSTPMVVSLVSSYYVLPSMAELARPIHSRSVFWAHRLGGYKYLGDAWFNTRTDHDHCGYRFCRCHLHRQCIKIAYWARLRYDKTMVMVGVMKSSS
jgi:hypothetical protein